MRHFDFRLVAGWPLYPRLGGIKSVSNRWLSSLAPLAFVRSSENMANRNKTRGVFVKDDPTDAHEERNMWIQILTDIRRLRGIHAKAAEIAKMQVDLEAKIGKCELETLMYMIYHAILILGFFGRSQR